MAQELVLIFDDLGNLYEIENITEMLSVMEDDELLPIYKSTVYEHKLTMAMEELVKKVTCNQVKDLITKKLEKKVFSI